MKGQIRRRSGMALGMALLWLLIGCEADDKAKTATQPQSQEAPATPVEVVTLEPQTVTLTAELSARVMPFRISLVRPQVDGIVIERFLGKDDGLEVEAGQPLYQIDPQRYQAAVQNARAQLQKAQANLAAVQTTEKRYQGLLGTKSVSQQQYDDVKALLQQREAEVAVAEAELESAEVDLRYTRITAPISGRIGEFMVTEGGLVEALQPQPLATIRQLDPIYIDMYQSAEQLSVLRQQALAGEIVPGDPMTVEITLEDGTPYPHKGEVQYTEMNVNMSTGSVLIRALVANPDRLLMPGQFVRAVLEEGEMENAVTIPQRAVSYNRGGEAQAMLVNDENKVELRTLSLGRSLGDRWLVKAGVSDGDRVVVAGLQKIRPGAPVEPTEAGDNTAAQR